MQSSSSSSDGNPLLATWTAPYGMPPFGEIKTEHFTPAFHASLDARAGEIEAIAALDAEPSFENTIAALERAGRAYERVCSAFFNLTSTDATPELQEIERAIAPVLAKRSNEIYLNAALFRRVDALIGRRESLGLTEEQGRVLERYHRAFVKSGARLEGAARSRIAAISERLAELTTQFSQNVLADESGYRLVLNGGDDLAGLPGFLREAARQAAAERGLAEKYVITLSRSSIEPFLQFSARRDLREQAFKAWAARGAGGGAHDNRAIIGEILALRRERAHLLGFDGFPALKLEHSMAKTPEAVRALLREVWGPAARKAGDERAALETLAHADGVNAAIEPWDWRYYAERRRKSEHALDEAEIKPFFQLENMIEAAFFVAGRLFGLSFKERHDLPLYHPDVRVWEAFGAEGRAVGLFVGDYFTRPSKRGGAWMSTFRDQERLDGEVAPVIVNVLNFVKAPPGEAALLSLDDARTLFHEFGHGLHGLLSDVTYPSVSGTSVTRDFVELPSQLYEHWLMTPEVLNRFAVHAQTRAPIPAELVEKLIAAQNFNQGFATVEYVASALMDMALHDADPGSAFDADAFEAAELAKMQMPQGVALRHRPPHFLHLFSGDGYAAGYYSYLWSEVMDADAFMAFEETGDVFHAETAEKLRRFIYSSGGKHDPAEAYVAFRGRMPSTMPLLVKRGLAEA